MITRLKLSCFPDEEDELTGESPAGLTDDEGIEDDHEESQVVKAEEGKSGGRTVRKSGTCDSLISLCRWVAAEAWENCWELEQDGNSCQ